MKTETSCLNLGPILDISLSIHRYSAMGGVLQLSSCNDTVGAGQKSCVEGIS
jgi:hypothetical protein